MFGTQAMRLLRSSWSGMFGAKGLSRELFAMFQDDIPLTQNAPVTMNQDGNAPALDLRRAPGSDGPLITFGNRTENYPGLTFSPQTPAGVGIDDNGGLNFTGPYINITYIQNGEPTTASLGGDGSGAPPIKADGGGGGGFPGTVTSGSGNDYQCDVYLAGLDKAPTNLPVRQLSIAAGEAVPAGTWAVIGSQKVGSLTTYFMQVPVWL